MREVIQASGGDKDRDIGSALPSCVPGCYAVDWSPGVAHPSCSRNPSPDWQAASPPAPCVPYTFPVHHNPEDVENQSPDNLLKFGCGKRRERGARGRGEESVWDAGVGACL